MRMAPTTFTPPACTSTSATSRCSMSSKAGSGSCTRARASRRSARVTASSSPPPSCTTSSSARTISRCWRSTRPPCTRRWWSTRCPRPPRRTEHSSRGMSSELVRGDGLFPPAAYARDDESSDGQFDGAMCAVSIQYVLHPRRLFREVHRVLRPGAPFLVSFSNRCFPTKAVAVWLSATDQQHLTLVRAYFEAAGGWTDAKDEDRSPGEDVDPLYAVWARRS